MTHALEPDEDKERRSSLLQAFEEANDRHRNALALVVQRRSALRDAEASLKQETDAVQAARVAMVVALNGPSSTESAR